MRIKVWGCRGSIPAPGPEKDKFGGNTSCVQVEYNDTCIILDGGSGIQRLGTSFNSKYKEVHILLTHLHLDHIMGIGFFLPLYDPEVDVHFYGPATMVEPFFKKLRRYFSPPLFPVRLSELSRHPVIHDLSINEFTIGDIQVKSSYICHPSATLGYRISTKASSFAYMPDHEVALGSANFPNEPEWTSGYDLAKNADLLFHDSQYSAEEYKSRIGWGHSSMSDAVAFAKLSKVKKLILFHHDPLRTDVQLQHFFKEFQKQHPTSFQLELCAEDRVYEL